MTARQHEIWQQLVRLHRAASGVVGGIEDWATARIAALVEQATEMMLAELANHPELVNDVTVRSLARIFGETVNRGVDVMVEMAAAAFEVGAGTAASGLAQFGVLSRPKIEAIANALDGSFRPQLLARGRAGWYERLAGDVMKPQSALMRALIEARINGRSLGDAARILLEADPTLAELPSVTRKISAEFRARMLVRSESNQILNTAGVLFNERGGITTFRNFGIGDERQADTCWMASLAEAQTIEKWSTYEAGPMERPVPWQKRVKVRQIPRQYVGPTGRHPQCRCQFVGVPEAFVPSRQLLVDAGLMVAA